MTVEREGEREKVRRKREEREGEEKERKRRKRSRKNRGILCAIQGFSLRAIRGGRLPSCV